MRNSEKTTARQLKRAQVQKKKQGRTAQTNKQYVGALNWKMTRSYFQPTEQQNGGIPIHVEECKMPEELSWLFLLKSFFWHAMVLARSWTK